MQLFLSGGGDSDKSFEYDKKFIEAIDTTKPVLYIPIAMPQETHSYGDCLKWVKNNFKPFSFDNFVMWTEEDLKIKKIEDFKQFGGIYIGGGNTFKLLKELKEFGTVEILIELAKQNIPIFGGSAGAIIWGKTICTAIGYDDNEVRLSDFSAFNKVFGYEIWCHYLIESEKSKVIEYMSKYKLKKVIVMPDDAGIIVRESSIEFVGPAASWIFDEEGVREIKAGSVINVVA